MSFYKKITALMLLSIPGYIYSQCDGSWQTDGSGNWSDPANWSPCVPNGMYDTAYLGSTPSGSVTITVDENIQISELQLNNTTGYTLNNPPGVTNSITFFPVPEVMAPILNILTGTNTINVPLSLGSNVASLDLVFPTFGPIPTLIIGSGVQLPPFSVIGTGVVEYAGEFFAVIGQSQFVNTTSVSIGNGQTWTINGNCNVSNEAAVILLNNGNVSGTGNGNFVAVADAVDSSGTFSNTNTGTVTTTTGFGSVVVTDSINNNGGIVINLNQGNVSGGSAATNANGGVSISVTGPATLNGGTTTIGNSGSVTGLNSIGSYVSVGGTFVVAGGNLNQNNQGNVSGTGTTGVTIQVGGDYTQSGGNTNVSNTGNVTVTPAVLSTKNNLSLNTAIETTSFGVLFQLRNFYLTGGSWTMANAGAASDGGIGIGFLADSFNISGGIFTISDYLGTVEASTTQGIETIAFGGIGALLQATSINVLGGMFINDGTVAAGQVIVGPGGFIAGSGSFWGPLPVTSDTRVENAGVLAPGDPGPGGIPGILTINGNYTQAPSGTLVINALNNSSVSELVVTGTANIAGSLEVAATPGFMVSFGKNFTILQANGGLTGTFNQIINYNLSPYFIPHVGYTPNSALLFFTPGLPIYVRLQQPVYSAVNETNLRLQNQMGRMRSHFAKRSSSMQTAKAQSNLPIDLVDHKVVADQTIEQEKTQRLSESLGVDTPWNFYIGPKGQVGNVLSKGDQQGYRDWSAGFFTGFDYAFSQVGLGLLAEYERVTAHAGKDWGKFTIDHVHASVYSTYAPMQLPEFSLQGIVGGGYDGYSIDRNIIGFNQVAKGSPGAGEFDAFLGVEYAFRESGFSVMPSGLQIIPLASLQYMYLSIDDYSEKNAGVFNMKVAHQNRKSLRTNLGFRMNYQWDWQDVSFSPELNLSWQREFLDKEESVRFTPVSTPAFPVSLELPQVGRNIALAGADFLVTLYGRHGIEAGYNFEYNSMYHTHFMYMSYNVRF